MTTFTNKGIARLSVIPVRAQPAESSEMVTQLLFGDHYEVLDKAKDSQWLPISIYSDRYEGWINGKQHYPISDEYYEQINVTDFKICTDVCAEILFKKNYMQILLGSVLPISANELFFMEEQFAYNGNSKRLGEKRQFDYVKEAAMKYLNAPYQWGGKTPFGIDCSGLVQMVFRLAGYTMRRDSKQQAMQGDPVESINEYLPGDLAFFGEDANISHVGILLENYEIIHASGKVRIDTISDLGISDKVTQRLTHKLIGLRRLLK